MKRLLQITCLVIGISFAFTSCQKTKDVIDPPTVTELLGDGSWILTELTIDPGIIEDGVVITNEYNQLADCEKDDLMLFSDTGGLTIDEGATKCNPDGEQIKAIGTWALNESEDQITSIIDGTTLIYNIIELTRTKLHLELVAVIDNITYTRTYKFEHN